jgi:lysyl-tRNA synthetase class II
MKQESKAKEKEEKQKAAVEAGKATGPAKEKVANDQQDEELIDPNEYHKLRLTQIMHMKSTEGAGAVYPHKFNVSISMTEFQEKYSYLTSEQVNDDMVSIAGNLLILTFFYKKILFYFEQILRSCLFEACHGL